MLKVYRIDRVEHAFPEIVLVAHEVKCSNFAIVVLCAGDEYTRVPVGVIYRAEYVKAERVTGSKMAQSSATRIADDCLGVASLPCCSLALCDFNKNG